VGCDNTCTFCIVPSLRGKEVDRRPGAVLAEVEALVAEGVVEITLLGQNVNSYGRSFGDRGAFAALLRSCGRIEGLERVRFTSPHPRDFTHDVIDAMATTPNVCPHLHMPLQSGSDTVLKAMRRSYRRDRYLGIIDRVRTALPGAAITTDIIVGFPGETEADFEATLEVVERVGYDGAFTFNYSPRRGTEAATLSDQVPHAVKRERMQRLVEAVQRRARERAQRFVGRTMEVLVEGPSRTDPTRARGRSRHNKAVNFEGTAAAGELVEVEIASATSQSLSGHERLLSRAG
jgi:tRNA-2-methylthio-N6-dimethylallyladenosine synthase